MTDARPASKVRTSRAQALLRGRLPALLSAAALAAAAGSASAGTPTTLGSMRFEAPDAAAGWSAKPLKGGLMLQKTFPPDADNRRRSGAIIEILGPFAGSPATLDAGFATVAGGVKGMAEEEPILTSDGATVNGHRIRTDYRCCAEMKGLSAAQRTVGIASGRNQVVMALIGLDLRGEAADSAEADFEALVRSVRLEASDRPFALEPRPGDGGLDGVYTHLDTGVRPNAFGGMDFYSDSTITVFHPSGLYATELPENGDIAAHCRAHPTDCGLYALKGDGSGGAGEIERRAVADPFGTIESETTSFARRGEDLAIDGGAYSRVPPPAAGAPFEGTWRSVFASAGSTAASSVSVSGERVLTLSRDGSFRRTGWSGASGTNEAGGATTGFTAGSDRPATAGRYAVEGYTLQLTGDDGRTERLSIFAPDKGSDALLVIGGSNYLKQE